MYNVKAKRTMRRMRMEASQSHSRVFYILRGICIAIIITVPIALIISLATYITDFPEEYISPAVLVTVAVAIILSSFFASAWQKNCGWSNGTITGFVYMLCILISRFIMEKRVSVDKDSITLLLLGLLIGSLSGYAGLKFMQISTNKRK